MRIDFFLLFLILPVTMKGLAHIATSLFYIFWISTCYQSRFIPEGVAEASQIFLRDPHVLPK
jgi:hypothetical protein